MLVLSVSEDLNKLLENGRVTSIAPLSELRGVVIMTVHLSVVLVIAVLSAEHGRTD